MSSYRALVEQTGAPRPLIQILPPLLNKTSELVSLSYARFSISTFFISGAFPSGIFLFLAHIYFDGGTLRVHAVHGVHLRHKQHGCLYVRVTTGFRRHGHMRSISGSLPVPG